MLLRSYSVLGFLSFVFSTFHSLTLFISHALLSSSQGWFYGWYYCWSCIFVTIISNISINAVIKLATEYKNFFFLLQKVSCVWIYTKFKLGIVDMLISCSKRLDFKNIVTTSRFKNKFSTKTLHASSYLPKPPHRNGPVFFFYSLSLYREEQGSVWVHGHWVFLFKDHQLAISFDAKLPLNLLQTHESQSCRSPSDCCIGSIFFFLQYRVLLK